jgi:hypothetical protein
MKGEKGRKEKQGKEGEERLSMGFFWRGAGVRKRENSIPCISP